MSTPLRDKSRLQWTPEELAVLDRARDKRFPLKVRPQGDISADLAEAMLLLWSLHGALQDDFDSSADWYDMPRGHLGKVHEEAKAFLIRKGLLKS